MSQNAKVSYTHAYIYNTKKKKLKKNDIFLKLIFILCVYLFKKKKFIHFHFRCKEQKFYIKQQTNNIHSFVETKIKIKPNWKKNL